MISQRNRFHGHNSLNFVYRKGRSVRADYFGLRYAPSKREDYRLAVVVSKKVSKQAVVRNRIRRRIYEAVRLIKADSNNAWRYDIVITVQSPEVAEIPYDELGAAVQAALQKANIL